MELHQHSENDLKKFADCHIRAVAQGDIPRQVRIFFACGYALYFEGDVEIKSPVSLQQEATILLRKVLGDSAEAELLSPSKELWP